MKLFSRKSAPHKAWDREALKPVIRSSICTGEKSAGFQEIATGRFREVMLIRTPEDLEEFRNTYGIEGQIETIY